jgi:hypothetical protein
MSIAKLHIIRCSSYDIVSEAVAESYTRVTMKAYAERRRKTKNAKLPVSSLTMSTSLKQPDFADGVRYWDNVEATNNGVLGGFGDGVRPFFSSAQPNC